MKATKEEVSYSEGKDTAHCGICRYYHRRACSLVKGDIAPEMWCTLFQSKERKFDAE